MKKLLFIALITFTLLSTTACGSKETPSENNSDYSTSDITGEIDLNSESGQALIISKINEPIISKNILREGPKTETTSPEGDLSTETTNNDGTVIIETAKVDGTKIIQINKPSGTKMTETIVPDQLKTVETINTDGTIIVETITLDGVVNTETTAPDGTKSSTTSKIHGSSTSGSDDSSSSESGSSDSASISNETTTQETITQENMTDTANTEMQLAPKKGDQIATLSTNIGDIKILLYTDLAPNTAKNFIELTNMKSYDGIIFHRVINDFMIQTGDFEFNNGTGGYTYLGKGTSLEDEFGAGLTHIRGAVSMANAGPNTGGSQFFIVQSKDGTDWLDGKHAIFGFVYEGMDVVDKIAKVEKNSSDKPLEDIVVEEVAISTF